MSQPDSRGFSWMQMPARRESLHPIQEFVLKEASVRGMPGDVLQKIELVLEEVLLNIINYAYPETDSGEVQTGCREQDSGDFQIRIMDHGAPFDPLKRPDPDTGRPVQHREVGGLGIHLVKNMADRVEYTRQDGRNILDIVFNAVSSPGHKPAHKDASTSN
ncbi:putative anti-sigma regulatory factor, serine/threonine protein kinase [Desulfonatronospira thiodismutans ASO3-1]|uniref:Anti-sigma regulatory factor, serine/threonine protein kinase n=1 Tax=Desulfonatronospira thiodismutans ASO3-1 TaxID=555779 RepID=D6SNU8_9BACT|nr:MULTISPECIES: ATP-binding protein [Desulfonatronospira]EFI34424.1 putative anti-sigma regulatory factor, serine/threonine protein kinase [Desulfonatronospira thiodismutans ASO3-1]